MNLFKSVLTLLTLVTALNSYALDNLDIEEIQNRGKCDNGFDMLNPTVNKDVAVIIERKGTEFTIRTLVAECHGGRWEHKPKDQLKEHTEDSVYITRNKLVALAKKDLSGIELETYLKIIGGDVSVPASLAVAGYVGLTSSVAGATVLLGMTPVGWGALAVASALFAYNEHTVGDAQLATRKGIKNCTLELLQKNSKWCSFIVEGHDGFVLNEGVSTHVNDSILNITR